jgi:hypothetical protein
MPNVINYAEQWSRELLQTIIQGTICSPFITDNVRWLNAKTFHFTQMVTSGYKNHSRTGGWNRGAVTQADIPYTLYHDRDIEFLVDKADVDESNQTATIQNISSKFVELQANPEMDAEFFSKVAKIAGENDLLTSTARSSYTVDNVFTRLKAMMKAGKLRVYRQRGSLVAYVCSDIMDLLERSKEFTRKIEMTQVADGGMGIETRVTEIDGVPLFEVADDERFYNDFDFSSADGGFVPADGAQKINVLFASVEMVKKVPKISSIYFFAPGQHTEGDGYLYQNRAYSGTFIFPNGKDNKIDSIFVDVDASSTTLTVASVAGTEIGDSKITVTEALLDETNVFKYKAAAVAPVIPAVGTKLGTGWITLESGKDITVTNGHKLVVVEVGANGIIDRTVAEAVTVVSKTE